MSEIVPETVSQTDLHNDPALAAGFDPPSREAWLALVGKVLKGAEFDKRLVARTLDGLAIQPLYTRADWAAEAAPVGRSGWYPGGWDMRQRHLEPDPAAANTAILEDLENGATSLLLQVLAPGQGGLSYGAEALHVALRGVALNGTAIALDARENTLDAAGSLIEVWRAAGINENERRGAFNYDPLGVLAETGTLYYPAQRSCEIAAKLAADTRSMSHVTALLADGRPCHEAGGSEAQELAATIQEQLYNLMAGKTVIAIAHRLSTIAAMDRLVILDHGRVVEEGTHASLLQKGGVYADLWARQSGGFLAEAVAAAE